MTERSRRSHHLQNQVRRQPTAPPQQTGSMYRSDNRPTYSIDSYTANNYRHPSSTTTMTDPSSSAPSSQLSDRCAISIFYSYLIAIFSSFLVVLGIYLSLTKFNYSFLSISLAGLLIEAFGACIYCISNIRSSRLARRKQRINSDDFILQNDGNIIENHNLDSGNFNRQQQITTITHILSNRNLNSNCITNNDDNHDIYNPIENGPTAINNTDIPSSPDLQISSHVDLDNERATNQNTSNTTIPKLTQQEDQVDSNNCGSFNNDGPPYNQLPKSINRIKSPEAISGDFSSSTTNLLENQQSSSRDTNSVTGDEQVPSQLSINMVSQFNSQLSDNDGSAKEHAMASGPIVMREELNSSIGSQSNHRNSNVQEAPQSSADSINRPNESSYPNHETTAMKNQVDNLDLTSAEEHQTTDLEQQEATPTASNNDQVEAQARRKKAPQSSSQRPANLRRTLVMGLGGEQEMIEIDEEDLDNMSILPPPYESIAANSRPNS